MNTKVRDVVRDVVAEVAPDEVLLLDSLAGLDDRRLTRLFAQRVRDEEPRGRDYVDVSAMVTPVVWMAVDEAARRTTDRTVDRFTPRRTPLLHHLFRRRPPSPSSIQSLTPAQLNSVRHLVRDHARAARLGDTAAEEVARAVVCRLVRESQG
ncbi:MULTISPECIES: hypothetical protein [unclassified Streptomyces]|uniref:hypothetical protein n=1 Tax=unclassified Streptomyces TaxID=2593676 RepID=UPI00278C4E86|nr:MULTISPECIES: hypothetical protein [unclassified Streptomyces]